MSRSIALELIGLLTGTLLGGVLNTRGYRFAASITLAASIVLAFFSLRSAVKDFFEFGSKYYTETAVALTLLTAALFWLYGVDHSKAAAVGQAPSRNWFWSLRDVVSETGTQLNLILDRHKRLANVLTAISLVLLIVPLSLSIWTLFVAPISQGTTAPVVGNAPPATPFAVDDAEAARQKQIERDQKLAEDERQRRAVEATQRKAKEEEATRQREDERQRLEREDAQRKAQEAEAQARAERERQQKLAAVPKPADPPAATTLNGFRLFPGTFMWGIAPSDDPLRRPSYTVKNIQECTTICRRFAGCVGFTYEGVSCFVFGRITSTRDSAAYTSGRR